MNALQYYIIDNIIRDPHRDRERKLYERDLEHASYGATLPDPVVDSDEDK